MPLRHDAMMEIEATLIPDVKLLTPRKLSDSRGFFSEVYSRKALLELGIGLDFVQDNHSFSSARGTVRGLHFQTQPTAQDKLIRVVRGAIMDVAVDVRRSSPTFGRHVSVELSASNWRQLLIPVGFAHGFCTLEPGTEVIYRVTNYYSAADERGLAWDDPTIAIAWPISRHDAVLSEKDRLNPTLDFSPDLFN